MNLPSLQDQVQWLWPTLTQQLASKFAALIFQRLEMAAAPALKREKFMLPCLFLFPDL